MWFSFFIQRFTIGIGFVYILFFTSLFCLLFFSYKKRKFEILMKFLLHGGHWIWKRQQHQISHHTFNFNLITFPSITSLFYIVQLNFLDLINLNCNFLSEIDRNSELKFKMQIWLKKIAINCLITKRKKFMLWILMYQSTFIV